MALCSHYLFTYSDHVTAEEHVQSALEMSRVAKEVRVFPLLNMDGRRSCHLDRVVERLRAEGLTTHVTRVPYEFQRGGNQMMAVLRD